MERTDGKRPFIIDKEIICRREARRRESYFRLGFRLLQVIEDEEITIKQLDIIIGQNRHAYQVFKLRLCFQNRLRHRIKRKENRLRKIKLNHWELDDL